MRSTFRNMLVALVAVVAFGALASASASAALPEFKNAVGSKFPATFTGTGGEVTIQVAGSGDYECKASSITGEIVGAKEVAKVIVKFTSGSPSCISFCKQTTEASWETKELKGRIAYLSKANHTVGLLLEAAAEPIAICKYEHTLTADIQGSIIGQIGEVNMERTGPFSLKFAQIEGKQQLRHFEGEELTHSLEVFPLAFKTDLETGLETTMSLTMSHTMEIEA